MAIRQYIFTATKAAITWSAAEAQSQDRGGHLASAATSDEHNFFIGVFTSTDPLHAGLFSAYGPWIGLIQAPGSVEPAGGWGWVDGTPMTETFWYGGQPDNLIGDNRGLYGSSPSTAGWGDHVDDPVAAGYPGVKSFITELTTGRVLLRGGADTDLVYGGSIANVIRTAGAADWIDGGGGADTMTGGAGRDRFHFSSAADADGDHLVDVTDADRIILTDIDANEHRAGNQPFHLVDDFTGHAGELTLTFGGGVTTIACDTDGDGSSDFSITADGDLTDFAGFAF